MSLSLGMGFTAAAWAALAGMDRLGWHHSVLHRPLDTPHSTPATHLTGSPPKTGDNSFTGPKVVAQPRRSVQPCELKRWIERVDEAHPLDEPTARPVLCQNVRDAVQFRRRPYKPLPVGEV